eukprot:c23034_g24_i1 orf=64-771(+)
MSLLHLSTQDFFSLVRKCRMEKDLVQALRLHHAFMSQSGLEGHASHLVLVLIELGSVCHAQQVFDRMAHRDELLWNALIAGYVKHNEPQHALSLYQIMHEKQDHHIRPSAYTLVALLKGCATLKDLNTGHRIHVEIARRGFLENNIFIGCSLVDMYAKCGYLSIAHEVFKGLPIRDVVSWNALITGYAELGCGKEAIDCLEQMRHERISGNAVTLVCGLKSCGSIGYIVKGQEIH